MKNLKTKSDPILTIAERKNNNKATVIQRAISIRARHIRTRRYGEMESYPRNTSISKEN